MKATLFKTLSNEKTFIELPSGLTVKEAFPDIDLENSIIVVNGKIQNPEYILKKNDVVMIRITPGVVSTTVLAITGIVLAVVAIGGAIYAGIKAYQAKDAANKALEELEKVKKLTNKSDIDNRPFLRGAANTLATGKSQPYIIGRHFFTPYLLSSPFYQITGTDGEDQYTYTVLECGFNKQIIQKISTDDITIKTFSDTVPQEKSYTLDNNIFLKDGLIEISQDGNLFTDLPQLNYQVKSVSCNDQIPHDSDVDKGNEEFLTYTLNQYAKDVDVAITFPYGLYATNDSGDKIETQVTITPQYSLDGGKVWKDFTFNNNGVKTNLFKRNVSSKELRFVAHKDFTPQDYNTLKANGQSAIYLRIRSNGNVDSAIKNDCYCLYYQSVCFDPEKSTQTELVAAKVIEDRERAFSTMLGLKFKATKINEDKLKKINIVTQGVARTWNGTSWSTDKKATRNPASWALEIETSPSHPASRRDDSELDLESFGEFYDYCETMGFKFDYTITQNTKKDDILNHIMEATGACVYYDIYGRRAIAIDKAQENALAIYNPQNIISIKNKKSFSRRTDGLRIKFVNSKDDLFQEDTYLVMREVNGAPLTLNENSIIKDLNVVGITEYEHIVKYARRLMAIEILRPKTTTIEVGNEGIFYTPFSKVLIQDDSLKIGIGKGFIVRECVWKNGILQTIRTDSVLSLDLNKAYGIIVNCYTQDKIKTLSVKVEGNGTKNELSVLTRIRASDELKIEEGNIFSLGELNADGEFDKVSTPYIITQIRRADKGFTLELVNYNEAIYNTGTIPEYKSNLTIKTSDSTKIIPADSVTHDELMEMKSLVDGSKAAQEAAQEAANEVVHGIHFTNVHKIRDMELSLEEIVAKMDDDARNASASISISEEAILLKVENLDEQQRAFISLTKDQILSQVDDMKNELTGLLSVQSGAVKALVQGGGASGQMSLSLELPVIIDATTRTKFVNASNETEVAAVYAKLDGTDFYAIKGNAGSAAVKTLWSKAVKASLIASQIDLSATQVNVAAEHVLITGTGSTKGQTLIDGGKIRAALIDVEKILTQNLVVKNGGSLQSANYTNGSSGWKIDSTGNAEFSNGVFRGEIKGGTINIGENFSVDENGSITARSGNFDQNCYFSGNIISNALISLNEVPVGSQITIPARTVLYDFEIGPANGSYNGINWTYAKCIKSSEKISSGISVVTMYHAKLYLYDENNSQITSYDYKMADQDKVLLPYDLVYTPTFSAITKTLKFIDLPTKKPSEANVVYRDGDYLKIS